MTLVKFNPKMKNTALLPGFDDVFESVLADTFFSERRMASVPAVNLSESPEAHLIELAAPGLNKEDFRISVEGDMLSISTQVSDEQSDTGKIYSKREYSFSAFTRAFALPDSADVDRIQANYTWRLHLEFAKLRTDNSNPIISA